MNANYDETELNMHSKGIAWKTWRGMEFLTQQQQEQVKEGCVEALVLKSQNFYILYAKLVLISLN